MVALTFCFLSLLLPANAQVFCQRVDPAVVTANSSAGIILRPAAGAKLWVCAAGASGTPCAPLSNLFTTAGAATTNPMTADTNGNFAPVCVGTPGRFKLQVGGTGLTTSTADGIIFPGDPVNGSFTTVTTGTLTVTGGSTLTGSVLVGAPRWMFDVPNNTFRSGSTAPITWSNNAFGNGTSDTGLSRTAAGEVSIGNGTNGDFSGTIKAAIHNATTGFQVAGAATSGRYLKGNGTNFVQSTGSASGTGSPTDCASTNKFVTTFTLNSDAAPTSNCTAVTLASAQFANQGTTTTVLHGNAAGNPSFGSVTTSDVNSTTGTGTRFSITSSTDTAADFGQMVIVGTPVHITGQNAAAGPTNLLAAPSSGTYYINAHCRTTTSGTGTTATISITYADEGGAKTATSATWALNSVTITGTTSMNYPAHISSGTAVQFSTAGTFGTSIYACDSWLQREN